MTETAGKLEGLRAELARQAEERERLEAEFQVRLAEAKAAREKVDAAFSEEAERTRQTEAELISLQRKREELREKFAREQLAAAELKQHTDEREKRLRETVADVGLESIYAELAARREEPASLEAESHIHVDVAKTASGCEPQDKFTREQDAAGAYKQHCAELENRLRQTTTELEAIKATQARQIEEHKRLEAEWRECSNTSQSAAETLKAEAARCRRLERNLVNLRNERNQIHDKFREEHRAGLKAMRRINELENRLAERTAEIKQAKAELKKHF
jgi:chromosome segregation ATPase